ncbi:MULTISPECIES: SMI1/KNR4 family protein [unclassified Streptomyces]|uniref:SMI1/KNR4 family protein n=1 Tax=unclassified Streptomyces TaxID=2593676 RepID=UPI000A9E7949|nr:MULTISPECIES: SMI1/KNR4 family protein [unclassified Streptomyces]
MKKLLSIASGAISTDSPNDVGFDNGTRSLKTLLNQKNGFYAFESALHVLPSGEVELPERSLEEWNSESLWKASYGDLMQDLTFFAEDLFGSQYAVASDGVVYSFNAETAEVSKFSESIAHWQDDIVADWNYATGYTVGHEWQALNGQLPPGHRLTPRIPFSVGGEFSSENMVPVEAAAALRYWGTFAISISDLQDGGQFNFNPKFIDKLICGIWSPTGKSVCQCFAQTVT